MKYLISHQMRVLAECFKNYRDVWDIVPGMLHLSFRDPKLGMRELRAVWYIGNYEGILKRLLAGLENIKGKDKFLKRKLYTKIFNQADELLRVFNILEKKNEVPAKNTNTELVDIVRILHERAESLTKRKMRLSKEDLDTIKSLLPIMQSFPPAVDKQVILLNKQYEQSKKKIDRDQELKDELKKGPNEKYDESKKKIDKDQELKRRIKRGPIRFAKRDLKIYLDMDSCITDFDKAVKKLGSKAAKGLKDGASEEEKQYMYDKIEEAGSEFWSGMEWYPKGQELWKIVEGYDPVFLSSPGKFKWAPAGKQNWVSEHLPGISLFLESDKYIYAEPDAVLIDDSSSNIESWKEAGGIGVLYDGDPESVKRQLEEIRKQP